MNNKLRTYKAFTLIELLVAIGILAMVLSFAGVIFRVSIDAHRTAIANAEIMQKLRAITEQLNADFKGLRKDGYLVLHCELLNRKEYQEDIYPSDFRADRIYYFCTGDFQSWFDTNIRSNIAQIYFGHDSISLTTELVSKWKLSRDITLITPGITSIDCEPTSYAQIKADKDALTNAYSLLDFGVPIDIQSDPNHVRRLMSQNVGEIKIEWTDNAKGPDDSVVWFGLNNAKRTESWPVEFEDTAITPRYRALWAPITPEEYWLKALKFTFTLYDSKAVIKGGRIFTHIVYLDN